MLWKTKFLSISSIMVKEENMSVERIRKPTSLFTILDNSVVITPITIKDFSLVFTIDQLKKVKS